MTPPTARAGDDPHRPPPRGSPRLPGRRAQWLRIARFAWLLLVAAVLARALFSNRAAIIDLARVERPWLLLVALLAGFGQLGLNAAIWRRALAATGAAVGWSTLVEVTARSVPARYVPGSIWYTLSRAALLRATGVGLGALTVTAVLEAVLTVVVSLTLGGALLGLTGRLPGPQLAGVAWVLVPAIMVSPPVLNTVLARAARRRGVVAPTLSWRDHSALLAWTAAFWALSALAFVWYLEAFDLPLPAGGAIAGAFLVAWAIGFLAPIAPQGTGAFEVAVVALLVGRADAALAVVVGGFRVLLGLRDTVAFGWGTWRARGTATGVSPATPPAGAARR